MTKKGPERTPAKKSASKPTAKRAKRTTAKTLGNQRKPKRTTAKKTAQKRSATKKPAPAAGPTASKRLASREATSPSESTPRSRVARAKTSARRVAPKSSGKPGRVPRAGPPTQPKSSARMLTRKDVDGFHLTLIQKRAQLVGDVDTLRGEALRGSRREAAGDLSSMPVHMADLGTDNYEMEFTLGLIESERAVLQEIDEALERIRDGTYGVCLATGKPIGKARLRAKPWAKYCYEHMLALEKGKQHGA